MADMSTVLREKCYVNGDWVNAASGETINVTDPATGETVATVPSLSKDEINGVIDDASAAFKSWKATAPKERADLLRKWFDAIMDHQDVLAELMTREQGKPLSESKGEIAYAASFIEWFSEEARRSYGDVIPPHETGKRILAIKQPVGVCAAITPWNFPAAMITRKAGPALAAGCTFIVKPASQTPLSALALAVLAEEVRYPQGRL